MRVERRADVFRRVRPLHADVHALGALAKDRGVDLGLVESAVGALANVVQRVADEADAGPHADIQIELLAHGDDRAVVHQALAAQFGFQFGLGFLVGFRSNGAEQAELVLLEQVDGAVGERVAFVAPDLPANVGMNVFGVEADGFQDSQGLGKDLIADAVARHGHYCVFRHSCSFSSCHPERSIVFRSRNTMRSRRTPTTYNKLG